MARWINCALATVASTAVAQAAPQLPQVFLDTTYAPPSGGTLHTVNAGDDLQAALDAAAPGDVISIQAGATFSGNYILRNKTGTGWIYLQTSDVAGLSCAASRVSPTQASSMPKIVSPNTQPAIAAEYGANHYRLVGLEITTTIADTSIENYGLVTFGVDPATGNVAPTLGDLAHDVTVDRCYIHGTTTGNVKRGIALEAISGAVVDSFIADIHVVGQDAQAVGSFDGAGPFKIVDNELEGAGENVLFGGADPAIANLVPSDIEIRGNHFFKPLSWKQGDPSFTGIAWTVKNLLELKNAQRVLVEGNLFENCWSMAQVGIPVLFTVRNQGGTAPWSAVSDVTFRRNHILHTAGGFNVSGTDNDFSSQETSRILIQDNLLEDITGNPAYQVLNVAGPAPAFTPGGVVDLTIDHNTSRFAGNSCVAMGDSTAVTDQHQGFRFTNNITERGTYGVHGSGTGEGTSCLSTFCTADYVFTGSVIVGDSTVATSYPANNFFPATLDDIGFVDYPAGDYHLAVSSPYKNLGSDGRDPGADVDAMNTATACALTGACSCSAPSPDGGAADAASGPDSGSVADAGANPPGPDASWSGDAGTGILRTGCGCGNGAGLYPFTLSLFPLINRRRRNVRS